jgi:DnaK suppressor protein
MSLKKNEIARFKKRLEEMKAQMSLLASSVTKEVKMPDESKGYSQHQADEGTDDFDRSISLQVSDEEFKILRQIDRALEKVEDGTYGMCDITGEEIPLARLEAIPYAVVTVKAQEMIEKGMIS